MALLKNRLFCGAGETRRGDTQVIGSETNFEAESTGMTVGPCVGGKVSLLPKCELRKSGGWRCRSPGAGNQQCWKDAHVPQPWHMVGA